MNIAEISVLTKDIHKLFCISPQNPQVSVVSATNMSITRATLDEKFNNDFISDIEFRDNNSGIELFAIYRNYNNNKAIISVATDGNDCWKRFLVTKELCHVYLDNKPEDYTVDILDLVSQIVSGNMRIDESSTISTAIHSEYLTIIFAFELLVPIQFDYMFDDEKLTDYDIAKIFMVPESIIELFSRDWYRKLRQQAFSD